MKANEILARNDDSRSTYNLEDFKREAKSAALSGARRNGLKRATVIGWVLEISTRGIALIVTYTDGGTRQFESRVAM